MHSFYILCLIFDYDTRFFPSLSPLYINMYIYVEYLSEELKVNRYVSVRFIECYLSSMYLFEDTLFVGLFSSQLFFVSREARANLRSELPGKGRH